MKIYLLLAHPDKASLNGVLADAYEKSAIEKGHEVRRQNLGELRFDPILWHGYKTIQERNSDMNMVKRAVLQFCGISPVKVTRFSGVRLSEEKTRLGWIEKVKRAVVL